MAVKNITPEELEKLRQSGEDVYLIDVRSPREYKKEHIPGSGLHPLGSLDAEEVKKKLAGRKPVIVCETSERSAMAAERLSSSGMDTALLDGGMKAWSRSGLPVERAQEGSGAPVISVERQVRIGAGLLVLTGSLLGLLVHPLYTLIAVFVGFGLVFAGVTGWCGMGLLLAKMPWNR